MRHSKKKDTSGGNYRFLKLLLVLAGTCFIVVGYSQSMRFDRLSVKQGLSNGNVNNLMQDSFGFIWVATEDGLNLYDGYKVTIFRTNPDDSTTITSNTILSLAEDQYKNIWIGTQNGLNLYNRELNRFERIYSIPDDNESLAGNGVGAIFVDKKKQLWLGGGGSLHLYNYETGKFKRFSHDPGNPNSLVNGNISDITTDGFNHIWVATNGGGLSMMNADGTFTNYRHDPADESGLNSDRITSLYCDSKQNLWVGTFNGGLNRFNERTRTFTHYTSNPNDPSSIGAQYIRDINEDLQGRIWISSDRSLDLMDEKNGTFTHFFHSPDDEKSLSSNIIVKVIFDTNGRMWVGTRYGGINIYDKDRYQFQLYRHNPLSKNSLSNNNATCFSEDDKGNVWVGTDGGGLNYFDRKAGLFTTLLHDPENPNSLTNDKVLAVHYSNRTNGVWIGMWDGGVNYYDLNTKKFRHYMPVPDNPRSLSDKNIFDIFEDSKGTIWIGTWGNGLSKYNKDTDDFTQYTPKSDDLNSIHASQIVNIVEDHHGMLWLAQSGGLTMMDPEKETFKRYTASDEAGSISDNALLSLHLDHKNRLWVGTNGRGLNVFDENTQKFQVYTRRDGLPNDAIMGILEDSDHNLWLSTNQGLCKFNADSITTKNYDESDGLQDNQFQRFSFASLSTGEMIFGGTNGFNLFDPKTIKDNPFKPDVYVVDFKLFNKPVPIGENEVLKKNIMLTRDMSLKYFQNSFTFEFLALNYRQTEKNQYKYIMEGFDEEWVDAGTERKASYTNLGPGEYVFRVIASNNDGVWNMEGAAISITVIPPFWKTAWFTSLMVLFLGSGTFGVIRYQQNKTRKQKEELKKIIDDQTQGLKKQNEEILRKNEIEKVQNWITQGLANFGDLISKHKGDMNELCDEILKNLAGYVGAQQGTIVVVNEDDGQDRHLKVIATYGVNENRLASDRIEIAEGLIGASFKDGQKKYLTNLPDNYLKIESGLGQIAPAGLLLLPLKTDDDIYGVIELAFLNDATDTVHEFLDKVAGVIALNIHAASLNHKTMMLLQQAKEQTEELRAQEEEMRQNMEEMEATQEELRRREDLKQQSAMEIEAIEENFKRKEREYLNEIAELKEQLAKIRKRPGELS